MKHQLNPKAKDMVSVEAIGFREGANGVAMEHGQQQIDALHVRLEGEVIESGAEHTKALEARANTLARESVDAKTRWQILREKHGNKHPRFFLPLFLLMISFGALAAEAFLLAPIMDIMGIADPDRQLVAAFAIVTVAAVCFHHYLERRQEQSRERLPQVLAALAMVGLVVLGIMRARQLEFAADRGGGPLAEFLSAHTWLGGTLFVLLTVGFPVAAAIALHQGAHQLHDWLHFRRARSKAKKLAAAAEQAQKQVEGEKERLEQQLQQLRERCKEWKAAHRAHHDLGVQVGAKRRPRWTVWAKATVVAALTFVAAVIVATVLAGNTLTTLGLLLSSLLAGASWLGAAVYFYRKWEHPSPEQYLKQADVRFRDDSQRTPQLKEPARTNGHFAGAIPAQAATARQLLTREN